MDSLDEVDAAMNGKEVNGRESQYDSITAIISVIYLLILLAFFFWTMFDTWIGRNLMATRLGYIIGGTDAGVYRLVALTVLGGGLGGVINGLRSFLQHGLVFDRRFTWKYITLPWLGATNALFVFALISSGLAIFGSSGATAGTDVSQIVAMFSVGVLAGYGSQDVFLWLDAQVTKLFKYEVMVPNLRNKSEEQAGETLRKVRLEMGAVTEVEREGAPAGGKVVTQIPEPGTMIDRGGAVAITLAIPQTIIGAPSIVPANGQFLADIVSITDEQVPGPLG